ncbi:hypothetical protein K449DRAFT_212206 [Hypoxylon sp. EC38]|nr:hypothetical protein K449DRAFT_212206 [Hypoxylon sp. EC38]
MSPSNSRPASIAKDAPRVVEEGQEPWQSPNQPSWNRARFGLLITSYILAIILFGLSVSGFAAPAGFSSFPVMGMPLAVAAFLYDTSEFIVMCVRRRKMGIPPAVSLGFELIISFGGLALAALMIVFTVDSWQWHRYYSGVPSGERGPPVPNYVDNGYFWFGISVAASIMAALLSLIHFTLFVRDCVEVDRQRKFAKQLPRETESTETPRGQESVSNVPAPSYQTVELDNYDDKTKSDLVRPPKDVPISKIMEANIIA